MHSSLKPIYLALGLVGACSLVNKFDPVNGVPAGGSGGAGGSLTAGGEGGISGSATGGSGAKGGTAGTGEGGEAGANNTGQPLGGGVIVVGTTVSGATAALSKHYVVLLDPSDGHEITRTDVGLTVLAVAYEAARDKWFVFTGNPGQGGTDPNGPLLVGSMTTTGFQVEQTVSVVKPTNQNTVAILNQRLLYRSAAHVGNTMIDDTLTLLDTSGTVKAIGKLTIPLQYSIVSAVGQANTGQAAGGRVFFLHDNPDDGMDNCVVTDAGTEEACNVFSSSLLIGAADTMLTLPSGAITPVAQIDRDGSVPALGIQPSGNTVVIVVPPRRAISTNAAVYRYNASTGATIAGGPISFSLESPTKKIDPTNSITIPAVAVDPCNDLLFAGELANTALLYGVPIGAAGGVAVPFDPNTQNGTVGYVAYEPFTKTLISYNFDVTNPTFSGFQVSGTATAPAFTARGKSGALPWKVPAGLVPAIVVVQNPVNPPCSATM
ncbi:MAG TPA: hypothetical protein VK745_05360 [Polyangiaceae bacterium]|nr:hypothetical protein [Polyangiaceae bacterium]